MFAYDNRLVRGKVVQYDSVACFKYRFVQLIFMQWQ